MFPLKYSALLQVPEKDVALILTLTDVLPIEIVVVFVETPTDVELIVPRLIVVALATIVGIPEPIEIEPIEIAALSWNAIVPRSPFVGI